VAIQENKLLNWITTSGCSPPRDDDFFVEIAVNHLQNKVSLS
jgi:hypothetical protein